MKVSMKELRQVIRTMIVKEMRDVLPGVLAQTLVEQYLKKLVTEAGVSARSSTSVPPVTRPSKLQELMQGTDEWEEETPAPMENSNEGVYDENPVIRAKGGAPRTNESRRRALSMVYGDDPENVLQDPRFKRQDEAVSRISAGNPDIAAMFEGTKPVTKESSTNMSETQQQFGEEGVPLDFLSKLGVDFGRVKQNVMGPVPSAAREPVDEEYLKTLERRRESLNRGPSRAS